MLACSVKLVRATRLSPKEKARDVEVVKRAAAWMMSPAEAGPLVTVGSDGGESCVTRALDVRGVAMRKAENMQGAAWWRMHALQTVHDFVT